MHDLGELEGDRRRIIAVLPIRQGGKAGFMYSLLDDADRGEVVVVGGRVRLGSCGGRRLVVGVEELLQLAGLARAWRTARHRWAGYQGDGENVKWRGYRPLLYWAPGSREAEEIRPENPRFMRMRPRSRSYGLAPAGDDDSIAGLVAREVIRSNQREPVGVVLHGPGDACTVATRFRILVLGRRPADQSLAWRIGALCAGDLDLELPGGPGYVFIDPELAAVVEQAAADIVAAA